LTANDVASSAPRQIYGVDFSGAAQAGKKIWLAQGVIEEEAWSIEACYRGADLPGSSVGRDRCLAALRDFISGAGASAFGLDFPFGLPGQLLKERRWEDFVLSFAERYTSPEAFRQACRASATGKELRRVTDKESRTPFSPYNLRLYRQTYFGIGDVLAPLVREGMACILPMQPATPGRPWVIEICPASTLRRAGLNGLYKGVRQEHYAARARILEELERSVPLTIPAALRSTILDDNEGDALDSVVAAVAVWRALRSESPTVGDNAAYTLEGYVYV
jgi:hypothetical protein